MAAVLFRTKERSVNEKCQNICKSFQIYYPTNDALSQILCSTLIEDLQMNLASELAKLFLPELQWYNFARRKLKQVGIFEVLINFNFYAIYKTKKLFNVNNVILLIVLNGIWQYSIPRTMLMWRIFNWKSYSDMSAKNVGRKENNFGVCSEEFHFNGLGHFLHFFCCLFAHASFFKSTLFSCQK